MLRRQGEERLVFVVAWNEWAEGNHLEPDVRYGRRYPEAVRDARAVGSRPLPRARICRRERATAALVASNDITIRRTGYGDRGGTPGERVSIVMPVYNHARYLQRTIARRRAGTARQSAGDAPLCDRVTLCCVDRVTHDLALAALSQCVRKCTVCARALCHRSRARIRRCRAPSASRRSDSRDAYSHFVIRELGQYIDTDFVLLIQWDGYVLNGAAWSDEFLGYDYYRRQVDLASRWPHRGQRRILAALERLLDALRDPHIVALPLEDEAICRTLSQLS